MPNAQLRRGTTAHTNASLSTAHPVDGSVGRTATAHVGAELTAGEPGGSG